MYESVFVAESAPVSASGQDAAKYDNVSKSRGTLVSVMSPNALSVRSSLKPQSESPSTSMNNASLLGP